MDPLSLTLAVITFATAVKDTVELAHTIHGSFAKVSTNLLKAQAAANDIKSTLDDLNSFCMRHHDILEDASDLRISLQDLTAKMRVFEVDIIPLIPQNGDGKKSRLMRGWSAWKNNNKIEDRIVELRSNVEKTIANFMMGALLRVETKLEKMHQTTGRGLQVIHREMMHFRTMHTSAGLTSSSALIEQLNLTADMGAYVAFQIADLSALLEELPMDHLAKTNPGPFSLPPVVIRVYSTLICIDLLRLGSRVTSCVSQVRHILEMKATTSSIFRASLILNHLAIALALLQMPHEAASISRFSVKLCRMLSLEDYVASAPHLAHRLRNLSVHAMNAGDPQSSIEAAEEAWTISTCIQNTDKSVHHRLLHCRILSQYAAVISQCNRERGIELSDQSVTLAEGIISLSGAQHLHIASLGNDGDLASQAGAEKELDIAQSKVALGTYARALRQLSNSLGSNGHLEESLLIKQRALAILYHMKAGHGDATCVDMELAESLYEIITHDIKSLLPRETLLSYAEECVRVYRHHTGQKPSERSRRLQHALFEKATVLDSMGRHEYSVDTWREIALVAQQLFRDDASYAYAVAKLRSICSPIMQKYEMASRKIPTPVILATPSPNSNTTGVEAARLYDLCLDLQNARKYSEAVIMARKSVDRYQLLASEDPLLWMQHVGKGTIELAHSYWFCGDRDGAYALGHESLQLFHTTSQASPSSLGGYCNALRINLKVAHIIEDDTKTTTRYREVLQHTRQLASQHPGNLDIGLISLRAEVCHGSTLIRLNRTRDAHLYFHSLINCWQDKSPCVAPCDFVDWRLIALTRYAHVLDMEGLTELALEMIQTGLDSAIPYNATDIFGRSLTAYCLKIYLLVNLGHYDTALCLAEEVLTTVQASWRTQLDLHVIAMNAVAAVVDRLHLHQRVVEVAAEAVRLCQSDDDMFCFQGPLMNGSTAVASTKHRSLQLLSLGHASLGRISEALEYARQAVEATMSLRSIWLPEFYFHQSYMESRSHLANILLMAGQVDAARLIYEERRDHLINEVKVREGYYRDLIPTLRVLGVIYCSDGRHNEGSAAAQELRLMLDRLDSVFHSLYMQVMSRLHYEVNAPVLRVVNDMREGLQCDHQAELTLLEG